MFSRWAAIFFATFFLAIGRHRRRRRQRRRRRRRASWDDESNLKLITTNLEKIIDSLFSFLGNGAATNMSKLWAHLPTSDLHKITTSLRLKKCSLCFVCFLPTGNKNRSFFRNWSTFLGRRLKRRYTDAPRNDDWFQDILSLDICLTS